MVRGITTEDKNKRPIEPCRNCGADAWWWRQTSPKAIGEWICGVCHPNPNKDDNIRESVSP